MNNMYLPPTEFAQIAGVSRQTLIFYDKKGIFSPAYRDDNGYRYYAVSQLDVIETIQVLQTIGLSLSEIQKYLENRNAESTCRLFRDQMDAFQKLISQYSRMIRMMAMKKELMDRADQVKLDTVYLEYRPELRMIRSRPVSPDGSDRYQILGEHIRMRKEMGYLLGHGVGGMVEWKRLLEQGLEKTEETCYYTILDPEDPAETADFLPGGDYLVYYHKGPYVSTWRTYSKIRDYAEQNGLDLDDWTYEEGLIDELAEADPEEYITEILVRIRRTGEGEA